MKKLFWVMRMMNPVHCEVWCDFNESYEPSDSDTQKYIGFIWLRTKSDGKQIFEAHTYYGEIRGKVFSNLLAAQLYIEQVIK